MCSKPDEFFLLQTNDFSDNTNFEVVMPTDDTIHFNSESAQDFHHLSGALNKELLLQYVTDQGS